MGPIEKSIKNGNSLNSKLLNTHWKFKQNYQNISNKKIDSMYKKIVNNKNFVGGKIMGDVGDFFLMIEK